MNNTNSLVDIKTFNHSIGKKLRIARLQANLSQEELGEKANLHRTFIGMVERGERNISIYALYKILSAMNISMDKFFAEKDNFFL